MKILTCGLSSALVSLLLVGCADPYTSYLRDNGYAPLSPAVETKSIGDCYRSPDAGSLPVTLIEHILNGAQYDNYMKYFLAGGDAALPAFSGDSDLSSSLDATFSTYVKAQLSAEHVTSYSVSATGAFQYICSEQDFKQKVGPVLAINLPNQNFKGLYSIVALLKVTSLTYEFKDQNNAKIDVTPGSAIEKIFQGDLDTSWKADANKDLSFKVPHFIGYKIALLDQTGIVPSSVAPVAPGSKHPKSEIVVTQQLSQSDVEALVFSRIRPQK